MNIPMYVYVITEDVPQLARTHMDVATAAIAGGADIIQFRDKLMSDAEFRSAAVKLLRLCRDACVPLIINDRVEIASKIGADGVHVGHEDMDVLSLRQKLPHGMIVGVSARNLDEALALDNNGADYLGVGPVFATGSKSDASEPIGISELQRICEAVKTPVVAIGGITTSNLPRVIESGAAGAAVISAVTHSPDMRAATTVLKNSWNTFHPTPRKHQGSAE